MMNRMMAMTSRVWSDGPDMKPKTRLSNQITRKMTAINHSNLSIVTPFLLMDTRHGRPVRFLPPWYATCR